MQKTAIWLVTSFSLVLLAGVRHNLDTRASEASCQPAPADSVHVSGNSPWFQASPRMQIIDERPQISDTREAPEPPQFIRLPLAPGAQSANQEFLAMSPAGVVLAQDQRLANPSQQSRHAHSSLKSSGLTLQRRLLSKIR